MPAKTLSDVETIRTRARVHIEKGAVTEGYRADRIEVIKILNAAEPAKNPVGKLQAR